MKKSNIKRFLSVVISSFFILQILPLGASAIEMPQTLSAYTMGKYILSPVKKFNMGRAGQLSYNNYNQEVIIQRDELNLSGADLAVDIDRYYNAYDTYLDNGSLYGNNWHTNYNVKLIYDSNSDCIHYCRDDGSKVDFKKTGVVENGLEKWTEVLDKQGPKMDILWCPTGTIDFSESFVETVTGQLFLFDELGRLKSEKHRELPDAEITVNYLNNTDMIDKIIDSSGREYFFEYNKERLISIVCKDNQGKSIFVSDTDGSQTELKLIYAYNNRGDLICVTYPDGKSISYEYTTTGELVKAINIDGVEVGVSYKGSLVDGVKQTVVNQPELVNKNISISRNSLKKVTLFDDGKREVQTYDQYGYPIIDDVSNVSPLPDHVCDKSDTSALNENKDAFHVNTINDYSNGITTKTISDGIVENSLLYDTNQNVVTSHIDGNGNLTKFDYNKNLNLTLMTAQVSNLTNDVLMENEYSYENDRLSTISHNNMTYFFDFNPFGDLELISIGDTIYALYDYDVGNGSLWKRMTFGNGQTVSQFYNKDGHVQGISFDDGLTVAFEYIYDKDGLLKGINDNRNQTKIVYNENLTQVVDNEGNTLFSFDFLDTNRIQYTIGDTVYEYHFHERYLEESGNKSYDTELTSSEQQLKTNYMLDEFGRDLSHSVQTKNGVTSNTEYSYPTTNTASQFNSFTYELQSQDIQQNTHLEYLYDKQGNIEKIMKDGKLESSFAYDEIGQLIRENEVANDTTTIYRHDKGGNIVEKILYPYTEEDAISNLPSEVYFYSYNDSDWRDKLTSYNTLPIMYDEIGNPVQYAGKSYEWSAGRQLETLVTKDNTYVYRYNEQGLRTNKEIYDAQGSRLIKSFEYFWSNNLLTAQKITSIDIDGTKNIQTVVFAYDSFSSDANVLSPIGFIVDGKHAYLYEKNALGDIVGVYLEDKKMASYTYDAFGNLLITDEKTDYDEALNPFYYRSYQLDRETSLYYLRSRYYVPEWGRFLNADVYTDTGTGLIGTNMFAYCDNNPVNVTDPTGYWGKNEHKEWTYDFLRESVYSTYLSKIADNSYETDVKFPAVNAAYQYIHFDRTAGEDDGRGIYFFSQADQAVSLCKSGASSDAMVQLGYGVHAIQDMIAHGQIGTEWALADHAVRPYFFAEGTDQRSWLKADDVTYKWTNDSMRRLVIDSGVTTSNYKTRSVRYEETGSNTGTAIVCFYLLLPASLRSTYFING